MTMISWDSFSTFALPSAMMAIASATFAWKAQKRSIVATILGLLAILTLVAFIAGLWQALQRPPLRTMGETRLWYSLFMLVAGLFTYLRWGFRWILSFSSLMAIVFMTINWLRPEIHDRSLMPALQSVWFVPHVTVYMFSYALLGVSFILALRGIITRKPTDFKVIDSLVYSGLSFFTIGMLTGSIWAKEAWGHYWSWDPKETWALVTWMLYLLYIHLRLKADYKPRVLLAVLILSFLTLQICWYGVNYLPSAKPGVHIYNN